MLLTLPVGSGRDNLSLMTQQQWTTAVALAEYLGVSGRTMVRWLREGRVRGSVVQSAHYADERPRATSRGQWRIYEDDVLDLLRRLRAGTRPPNSLWRR